MEAEPLDDAPRPPAPTLLGRARALAERALGKLPAAGALDERETLFVAALVIVTTLAMLAGEHHRMKGGPMVAAAWRLLVHGALPFGFVACFFSFARRRGALLGALALLAPAALTLARLIEPKALVVLQETAAPCLVVTVGAFVIGGASLARAGVPAASFGVGLGDVRFWLPRAGLALLVMVPTLVVVVLLSDGLQGLYPMHKPARTDAGALAWHLGAVALDFVGWELLFRGVLLFGLLRRGDPWMAILLPAVPFALLHGDKPVVELVASLFGGIVSAWFTIGARSVLPLWFLHVVMISTVSVVAFVLRMP